MKKVQERRANAALRYSAIKNWGLEFYEEEQVLLIVQLCTFMLQIDDGDFFFL